MRIVFMGTPEFAAASLEKMLDEGFDVVGVFTQPDRARGRGMAMSFSPVKELALAHGLPVFQPQTLRTGEAYEELCVLKPDILAVVAYGRLLPDEFLHLPKYGAINVHASLLPKYRGAAPIQWAVLNGDRMTGVSTMVLAHDMDTGDIIFTRETEIGEKETAGALSERLQIMGAELLAETLRAIEDGTAPRTPQDHSQASYVGMLDKSLSPIDWSRPARLVSKQIFGLQPWPVATMELDGAVLRVFDADLTHRQTKAVPGTVLAAGNEGIEIACGDGETILLTELQAAGKKRMKAADYLRGHPVKTGQRL